MNSYIVYVLYNSSNPNFVKIGYTKNIENRIKDLNTGTPEYYELSSYIESKKKLSDKNIHKIIHILHPELSSNKKNSEFFNLCECRAFELIKNIAEINNLNYTKKYKECRNHIFFNNLKKNNWNLNEKIFCNKGAYTFKEIGINKGDILRYKYNKLLKIIVFNEIGYIQIIYPNENINNISLNQFCLIENTFLAKIYRNNFGKFFYHDGMTLYSKLKRIKKEKKLIKKYLGD